jgi:hypothetical protein
MTLHATLRDTIELASFTHNGRRVGEAPAHGVRWSTRLARGLGSVGLVLLGAASLGACSDDRMGAPPPPPPNAVAVSDLGRGDGLFHAACVEGAVETCSIELGTHEGIISCYEGSRTCLGGSFGACTDGRSFEVTAAREAASSPQLHPLAFSTASDCVNNPCNRYCREFNEAPPLGLSADVDGTAPPITTWPTGNLGDYPPGTVVVGNQEPCETAGDCQFNTACHDPALGSCGHSVCAASEPLVPGCNRCADSVCAIDPTCCDTPNACIHDPCEVGSGAALDPSCDRCVNAVCAAHPSCCGTSWDAACVGFVATECAPLGQSCGCPDGSVAETGAATSSGKQPSTLAWHTLLAARSAPTGA